MSCNRERASKSIDDAAGDFFMFDMITRGTSLMSSDKYAFLDCQMNCRRIISSAAETTTTEIPSLKHDVGSDKKRQAFSEPEFGGSGNKIYGDWIMLTPD